MPNDKELPVEPETTNEPEVEEKEADDKSDSSERDQLLKFYEEHPEAVEKWTDAGGLISIREVEEPDPVEGEE